MLNYELSRRHLTIGSVIYELCLGGVIDSCHEGGDISQPDGSFTWNSDFSYVSLISDVRLSASPSGGTWRG